MAFNIEEFKSNGVIDGGARPSMFRVFISDWPGSNADGTQSLEFLCKASQIPPSVMGQIEVPYMGRRIKVIGDRQYANWNITVMNRADFNLRKTFELWHENMNLHIENVTGNTTPAPISYKRDGLVQQLGRDGTILASYSLKGIFPVQIDAIPLDWESIDQIELFDVEFSIDYFLPYSDTGAGSEVFAPENSGNISIG